MEKDFKVQRHKERARYDDESLYKVLDACNFAHVGFLSNGQHFVIPMMYGRINDTIFLHGYISTRIVKAMSAAPLCISVAEMDSLVMASTVTNHSCDYRSCCIYGYGELVEDQAEKRQGLKAVMDHVCKQRWEDIGGASDAEVDQVGVIKVKIEEATVKIRDCGLNEKPTGNSQIWTGVIPIRRVMESPVSTPAAAAAAAPVSTSAPTIPQYINELIEQNNKNK